MNVKLLIPLSFVLLQSCATILSGTKAKIHIADGMPEKAKVYCNSEYQGTAPCSFEVKKKKGQILEIRKEGYQTQTTELTRGIMPGYIVYYIIFLDIISTAIDFSNGACYKMDQTLIRYDLDKK